MNKNIASILILVVVFLSFLILASFLARTAIDNPDNFGEKFLVKTAEITEISWNWLVKFLEKAGEKLKSFFGSLWNSSIKPFFKKKVEEKVPQVREEFKKETKEIKAEALKASQWLWERGTGIIKKKYF